MDNMQPRIVVMASGQGSTFEALAEACQEKVLDAEISTLIISRDGIGAAEKAHKFGIPVLVFSPKEFRSRYQWDMHLAQALQTLNPDLIVLAGFMLKLGPETVRAFPKKIINTHPSLLPKFGGQGMYGRKVHEAVLAAGERETGVTVHYVDDEYDAGPVLSQAKVDVLDGDTPESLEERLKSLEKKHLIETIAALLKLM